MKKKAQAKLNNLFNEMSELKKTFLGYPCDAEFDYSPLYKFLEFPMNNVGDPFEGSTYRIQTKEFEREVLEFFAKLYNIKNYWGYVTNGGTEGNLYGLYAARETLGNVPVLFSEHTHYSIKKNVHILGMKHRLVKSNSEGEIDYADFEKKIGKSKKVIVVANIGSTMTGAVDDVQKLSRIMDKKKIKYYIHADCALYGMILPFVSDIKFDFRTKINSMAVSGHKFIGSPIPCGVVLARKSAVKSLQEYIEYIDAHDTTLSGSRDAFTPLVFWYRIMTKGMSGFKKQVKYSCDLADFFVNELNKIGWPKVGQSLVTVRFAKPSDKLVNKWELAAHDGMAHVICLPHESKKLLKEFVNDLKSEM